MLRGRFPLASRANFRGDDVIVVIDAGDACVAESTDTPQDGQMIFRTSGPVPFALRLQRSQCTIQGFVNPFDLR